MADVAADLAERGERAGGEPWRWRPVARIAEALAAEGDRRILWLPVFFGTGIALYFTPTVEPPWWLGLAATTFLVLAGILLRRRPASRNAAIALAFCGAGLAVMQQARWDRGAPMLDNRIGPIALTGRVIDVDLLDRGWRVIVAPDPLPGLAASEQPRRVRLHIGPTSDELRPGDRLQVKAMLFPVPGQVFPGGRDMQRELYFAGIGGVGYSYGGARRITSPGEARGDGGWREWLLQLRNEMTRRIAAALPGSTGGVASAVITGKRGTMADGGEAGVSRFRPVAFVGDRRSASRVGRRVCVLRRARRARADPLDRAALPDQENRGL